MTRETFSRTPVYTINTDGPYTITHPYGEDELIVRVIKDGVTTDLGPSDYVIAPTQSDLSGDLTLTAGAFALFSGGQLYITRQTEVEQGWVGRSAREKGLESQLDRLTMAIQDTAADIETAVRIPGVTNRVLPAAERVLGFDENLQLAVGPSFADIAGTQAAALAVLDAIDGVDFGTLISRNGNEILSNKTFSDDTEFQSNVNVAGALVVDGNDVGDILGSLSADTQTLSNDVQTLQNEGVTREGAETLSNKTFADETTFQGEISVNALARVQDLFIENTTGPTAALLLNNTSPARINNLVRFSEAGVPRFDLINNFDTNRLFVHRYDEAGAYRNSALRIEPATSADPILNDCVEIQADGALKLNYGLKSEQNSFFDGGGNINWRGRMFIGVGYDHNGETDGNVTGGSFLQSFVSPGEISTVDGLDYWEDQGQVVSVADFGIAGSFVSRTSGGGNGIGLVAGVMQDGAASTSAWAAYVDGFRFAGSGSLITQEIECANIGGPSPQGGMTPYNSFVQGHAIALGIGAGSDAAVFGRSYAIDAFMQMGGNGSFGHAGIVSRFDALLREGTADGPGSTGLGTGYGRAMSLASNHGISWYSQDPESSPGTQQEAVRMASRVTDPAVRHHMTWLDAGVAFGDRVGAEYYSCVIGYNPNAQSGIRINPGSAGEPVGLQAIGEGPNIDIALITEGIGRVWLGQYFVAADAPIVGHINVKDDQGNVRKVAVIN